MNLKSYCLNKILESYLEENKNGVVRTYNAFSLGGPSFISVNANLRFEHWVTSKTESFMRIVIHDKKGKALKNVTVYAHALIKEPCTTYKDGVLRFDSSSSKKTNREHVGAFMKALEEVIQGSKVFKTHERFSFFRSQRIMPPSERKHSFDELADYVLHNPWSVFFDTTQPLNDELTRYLENTGLEKVFNSYEHYYSLWKEITEFKNTISKEKVIWNLGPFGTGSLNDEIPLTERFFLNILLRADRIEKMVIDPKIAKRISKVLIQENCPFLFQFLLTYEKSNGTKEHKRRIFTESFSEFVTDELKSFLITRFKNDPKFARSRRSLIPLLFKERSTKDDSLIQIIKGLVSIGCSWELEELFQENISDPNLFSFAVEVVEKQIAHLKERLENNRQGRAYMFDGGYKPAVEHLPENLRLSVFFHEYRTLIFRTNSALALLGTDEKVSPLFEEDCKSYEALVNNPKEIHFEFMTTLEEHGFNLTIPSHHPAFDQRVITDKNVFLGIAKDLVFSKELPKETKRTILSAIEKIFRPEEVIKDRIAQAQAILERTIKARISS